MTQSDKAALTELATRPIGRTQPDKAALADAVDKVLAADKWPICRTYDDAGLSKAGYVEFCGEVFAALRAPDGMREALEFLMQTRWKSIDKDNMEFEGRVTCYQLDKARAALAAPSVKTSEKGN